MKVGNNNIIAKRLASFFFRNLRQNKTKNDSRIKLFCFEFRNIHLPFCLAKKTFLILMRNFCGAYIRS